MCALNALGPNCCCVEINPGSCEDFDAPICYVDKHASGAGNGTSWADAYTTIGAAITAGAGRIWIQGYGSSDAYTENIYDIYPHSISGIGDVWINGYIKIIGCLYNLTITGNTGVSIGSGSTAKVVAYGATLTCVQCTITNSSGTSLVGFYGCTCTDCIVTQCSALAAGFAQGTQTNCVVSSISDASSGFYSCICYGCTVSSITTVTAYLSGGAFLSCQPCTGCVVNGYHVTQYSGYFSGFVGNLSAVYTDCIVSNITNDSSVANIKGFSAGLGATYINCTCTTPYPEDGCF